MSFFFRASMEERKIRKSAMFSGFILNFLIASILAASFKDEGCISVTGALRLATLISIVDEICSAAGAGESEEEVVTAAHAVNVQHFSHNVKMRKAFQFKVFGDFRDLDSSMAHLGEFQFVGVGNRQAEIPEIEAVLQKQSVQFRMNETSHIMEFQQMILYSNCLHYY